MAISGMGFGQFVMVNIIDSLIQRTGWRSTVRYLALIEAVGLTIVAALLKRFIPCRDNSLEINLRQTAIEYFQINNFKYAWYAFAIATFAYMIPLVHMTTFAIAHHISITQASFILAIAGLASASGRIAVGVLADRLGRFTMFRVSVLGASIVIFCWLSMTTYIDLLIFAVLFGVFAGGFISMVPAVGAECMNEVSKVGTAVGMMRTAITPGFLLASPIAGWLFSAQNDYTVPIYFAGAMAGIGFLLTLGIRDSEKYQAPRTAAGVASASDDSAGLVDKDRVSSSQKSNKSVSSITSKRSDASRSSNKSPRSRRSSSDVESQKHQQLKAIARSLLLKDEEDKGTELLTASVVSEGHLVHGENADKDSAVDADDMEYLSGEEYDEDGEDGEDEGDDESKEGNAPFGSNYTMLSAAL